MSKIEIYPTTVLTTTGTLSQALGAKRIFEYEGRYLLMVNGLLEGALFGSRKISFGQAFTSCHDNLQ